MREFPGYTSIEQIGETLHAVVFRAVSLSHQEPVVIKAIKVDGPSQGEIARFRHEFELIKGIGKSALVGEIHKPIVEKHGYFIAGKYDQFRKDVPYSSIIQAFKGLIRQLLSESDERIASWREKLLEELGPNGKVITVVIPDLEHIIGKQPDVETLGPEESQNRFNLMFQNFVSVFSSADHPLTIFLDDLQWADPASLKLIKTILAGPIKYLLLIGAYRDNQVSPHHPFMLTIGEILKKQVAMHTLKLSPLDTLNVNRIIANFLRCGPDVSSSLAMVVHEKTLGNPFFIIQFLKTLYEDKYLVLDSVNGWQWDADTIQNVQVTDNVVEFMAGKISSMPSRILETLKTCACIGNRFDLETLAVVCGRTIDAMLDDLTEVIQGNLVSLHGDIYAKVMELEKAHPSLIRDAFTPDRMELLRIFASQAAISLENARLFELATTDGMTRLSMHRYFQLLLDQEVQRAKRSMEPFSLVMIDIDDFKHFNDTYGHQMGDEVIRRVARALKSSIREVDTAARYGGEEFVLILPGTDTKGGLVVAENARKAVEDVSIPYGGETLKVTVSLGPATFPFHAAEKEALIKSADAALYISKRSGKNRVSTGSG